MLRSAAALSVFAAELPWKVRSANVSDTPVEPLVASPDGVPVAFLLSDDTVMIDFAGPWEVFDDAQVAGHMQPAFKLYTVAQTTKPVRMSGGATIVPQFTFETAPKPKVVVVPAQSDPTAATKTWLVDMSRQADLVMSICTGAFVLAKAGLLDGYTVTTHHSSFTTLAMRYPNVTVKRGVRFVDNGRIATSAGLSAGIDLALHVVARYYGKEAAFQTAYDMEYESKHWSDGSNPAYRKPQVVKAPYVACEVCWMELDPKTALTLTYKGKQYYFCMPVHEKLFTSAPNRFLNA